MVTSNPYPVAPQSHGPSRPTPCRSCSTLQPTSGWVPLTTARTLLIFSLSPAPRKQRERVLMP